MYRLDNGYRTINGTVYDPDKSGIDASTESLVSIGYSDHKIHTGDYYFIKTFITDVEGTGSVNFFSFTAPDTAERIHARAIIVPDVDTEVSIYEDATITGGTPVVGQNCERNSSNTASLVASAAPTVSVAGNKIWTARTGGGRGPVGVAPGLNYEIIAKQNSTYVFEIIKRTTADLVVDIDFFWFEHTSKN
jgi:hypothetical protein